jgi:hypothetical protein
VTHRSSPSCGCPCRFGGAWSSKTSRGSSRPRGRSLRRPRHRRPGVGAPTNLPMDVGIGHEDDPPPDQLADVATFVAGDAAASRTCWSPGSRSLRWDASPTPATEAPATWDRRRCVCSAARAHLARVGKLPFQSDPERHPDRVRFVQTAGGRTGPPAHRPVRRPPFVRVTSPTAWTTLALTIHADGRVEHEVVDASPSRATGSTTATAGWPPRAAPSTSRPGRRPTSGTAPPGESSPAPRR